MPDVQTVRASFRAHISVGKYSTPYSQVYKRRRSPTRLYRAEQLSKICGDRRCPRTAKPEIHAELGLPADFDVDNDPMPPPERRKCRLLCKNCHKEREQWDPRAQRA